MIWITISLIFPAIILIVAMNCYKKDGRLIKAFCVRMSFQYLTRRFYVNAVMILLLLFLCLLTRCGADVIDTFPPLILIAMLIRHKLAEWIFDSLKRRKVLITTDILMLVSLFTPHLYPLAVSLALIITAAIFYPSKRIRSLVQGPNAFQMLMFDQSKIICYYFE